MCTGWSLGRISGTILATATAVVGKADEAVDCLPTETFRLLWELLLGAGYPVVDVLAVLRECE